MVLTQSVLKAPTWKIPHVPAKQDTLKMLRQDNVKVSDSTSVATYILMNNVCIIMLIILQMLMSVQ